MKEAGHGHIINITSGASRMPGEGPYPEHAPTTLTRPCTPRVRPTPGTVS